MKQYLDTQGAEYLINKISERALLDTDGNVDAQGYHLGTQIYKSLGDGLHIDDENQLCITTATDEEIEDIIIGIRDIFDDKDSTKLSPGAYDIDGNLLKNWDQLIADGDITLNNNTILGNSTALNGAEVNRLIIADGVTSIGKEAFNQCATLEYVDMPDTVTSIDRYAFFNCSKLRQIVIPSGVTYIGLYAYRGCTSVESIYVSDTVTDVLDSGFPTNSTNLVSIRVDPNNQTYDSRNDCNAIIRSVEPSSNLLVFGCRNTVIPDTVTKINGLAFVGCASLMEITIPESVTQIMNSAFKNCIGLTEITIPNNVTDIGNQVFYGCDNLHTIHYSGTATGAPWGAPNATIVP